MKISIPFFLYPFVTGIVCIWAFEQRSRCPDSHTCGFGPSHPLFWVAGPNPSMYPRL